MAKLSRDLSTGTLHPRENIVGSGTLGALNAEIVINADGASTVSLDLRGTFSLTVEVAGSVDGVNWTLLPVRPVIGGSYAASIAGTAAGVWVATCAGFAKVRARATAYTSGAATAVLLAATGMLDDRLLGEVSSQTVTNTGVAGAAVTLTLAAAGAGLRHYITGLHLERHASAALTAYPQFGCKQDYTYKVQKTWGIFKEVFCPTDETFKFLEDVIDENPQLAYSQLCEP